MKHFPTTEQALHFHLTHRSCNKERLNIQIGMLLATTLQRRHWLNSEFISPPGLSWKLTVTKILPCFRAYSYLSWVMSNILFWCVELAIQNTIQNSSIFPLSHDVLWLLFQFMIQSVFSWLSWKHEVSGEQQHCSQRWTSKCCSTEPCWKITLSNQSPPPCVIISKPSHMLGFKLKSLYLLRTRFFLGLLLLSIHFIPLPPKNSKQNHFAGSEPTRLIKLSNSL